MVRVVDEVVQHFASGTTIHGVPKLLKAQSLQGKIFWSMICLSALGVFIFELVLLLSKYFEHPKSVDVKIVQEPVAFPSVSVCSVYAIDPFVIHEIYKRKTESQKDSAMATYNAGYRFTRDMSGELDDTQLGVENAFIKWYLNDFIEKSSDFMSKRENRLAIKRLLGSNAKEKLRTEFLPSLASRLTLTANMLHEHVDFPGIKPKEFIALCRYARKECSYEHFTTVFDPYYFDCFTFNASIIAGARKTLAEGIENALSLVMYIPELHNDLKSNKMKTHLPGILGHDLRDPLSGSGGVRVVIHAPGTHPYPATDGFDVMPGSSVSIGVKTTENTRLGRPYGNCRRDEDDTIQIQRNPNMYKYTMTSCRKKCQQSHLLKDKPKGCACLDVNLPTFTEVEHGEYCARFDDVPKHCQNKTECAELKARWLKRMNCMHDAEANSNSLVGECDCHPPCEDVNYDFFYSSTPWPDANYVNGVYRDLFISHKFQDKFDNVEKRTSYFGDGIESGLDNDGRIKKTVGRLARLNVYLYDTNVVKITENEDYTGIQLISDVGGQLGLWLGVSIITLTEVFELIAHILHIVCKRDDKRDRVVPHEELSYEGLPMPEIPHNYE